MYFISLESYEAYLSNGIWYIFIGILDPEIHCDYYKSTNLTNGFVPHCISSRETCEFEYQKSAAGL